MESSPIVRVVVAYLKVYPILQRLICHIDPAPWKIQTDRLYLGRTDPMLHFKKTPRSRRERLGEDGGGYTVTNT
jgi:hypothetical protein